MFRRLIAPLALAVSVAAPLAFVSAAPAEARPGWKGHGGWHHGGPHWRGGYGYRRHGWHRGWGGPPRWAPAYGYRRHHWGPRYGYYRW